MLPAHYGLLLMSRLTNEDAQRLHYRTTLIFPITRLMQRLEFF
jgi:hypothetical protein